MTKRVVVLAVLVVGFAFTAMHGCGGDSSDKTSVCMKSCAKINECLSMTNDCAAECANLPTCTNESQIISAANNCVGMACPAAAGCLATVPTCQTGTGTGGTTGNAGTSGGGAGTTGSGGTTGGGGCASCVKFQACCLAASPASCTTDVGAACMAQPAANQAASNSACAMGLAQIAPLFPNIAACQ
jgi:hypothetical protein